MLQHQHQKSMSGTVRLQSARYDFRKDVEQPKDTKQKTEVLVVAFLNSQRERVDESYNVPVADGSKQPGRGQGGAATAMIRSIRVACRAIF